MKYVGYYVSQALKYGYQEVFYAQFNQKLLTDTKEQIFSFLYIIYIFSYVE